MRRKEHAAAPRTITVSRMKLWSVFLLTNALRGGVHVVNSWSAMTVAPQRISIAVRALFCDRTTARAGWRTCLMVVAMWTWSTACRTAVRHAVKQSRADAL